MKRIALALLTFLPFVAVAADDWTVVAPETNQRFVVLPDTAAATATGDEWFATVNIFTGDKFMGRIRAHVNGCEKNYQKGNTVWVISGKPGEVWEWERRGDRVFDLVAFNVCRAAYSKGLFHWEGAPPQKFNNPAPAPSRTF